MRTEYVKIDNYIFFLRGCVIGANEFTSPAVGNQNADKCGASTVKPELCQCGCNQTLCPVCRSVGILPGSYSCDNITCQYFGALDQFKKWEKVVDIYYDAYHGDTVANNLDVVVKKPAIKRKYNKDGTLRKKRGRKKKKKKVEQVVVVEEEEEEEEEEKPSNNYDIFDNIDKNDFMKFIGL